MHRIPHFVAGIWVHTSWLQPWVPHITLLDGIVAQLAVCKPGLLYEYQPVLRVKSQKVASRIQPGRCVLETASTLPPMTGLTGAEQQRRTHQCRFREAAP